MISSYVGVITHRGLELFLPETQRASLFMQRQVRRCRQGHACSVWFVLDGRIAELVGELIASDESGAAWTIVEQQARDGGIILPEHTALADFMQVM